MISLEINIKRKDVDLNEKNNQYEILSVELRESKDRVISISKDLEETKDALAIATGKINSLEMIMLH